MDALAVDSPSIIFFPLIQVNSKHASTRDRFNLKISTENIRYLFLSTVNVFRLVKCSIRKLHVKDEPSVFEQP